jgi:hypothetical protein
MPFVKMQKKISILRFCFFAVAQVEAISAKKEKRKKGIG